jgi:hypothetical protein
MCLRAADPTNVSSPSTIRSVLLMVANQSPIIRDQNYGVSQAARSAATGRRSITGSQAIPITSESILELSSPITGTFTAEEFSYEASNLGPSSMHYSDLSLGFDSLPVDTDLYRTRISDSNLPLDFPGERSEQRLGLPTVTTGVLSNHLIHVPGGVDQFVSFPNTPDAPMPAKLLIQYCEFPPTSPVDLTDITRHNSPSTMDVLPR